jgi:hypothetical protein
MTPWGLVNCKVFGLQGPSLTNRVSELFTHGSVGGVGRKPGPYPALFKQGGRPGRLRPRARGLPVVAGSLGGEFAQCLGLQLRH